MKLWLASANVGEIEEGSRFPICGIITNPTVMAAEKQFWIKTAVAVDTQGTTPFHLQVLSTDEATILEEAHAYRSVFSHRPLILKLPVCEASLHLVDRFHKMGLAVNITAVCTLAQAILAVQAGSDYISVYVGRVSDGGGDGIKLIRDIRAYCDLNGATTEIIAASVRTVEQFDQVALAGAHGVAIPLALLRETLASPLTDKSIAAFEEDWKPVATKS